MHHGRTPLSFLIAATNLQFISLSHQIITTGQKAKVKELYNWTKIAQDTHFSYQKAICETMAERQAKQIAQEKAAKVKKIVEKKNLNIYHLQ